MLRYSGGLSLLRGRLRVQVVVDNHTIDDSMAAHLWDATKGAQNGEGPISVQRFASCTRSRLLTNMRHHHTLEWRFPGRKRRFREYNTTRGALLGVLRVFGQMRGWARVKFVGIRTNSHEIRAKFVRIRTNSRPWFSYGLAGLGTFRFGRRLGMVDAFGAGRGDGQPQVFDSHSPLCAQNNLL